MELKSLDTRDFMKKDGVRKSRYGIPNIDTDNSLKSKIINLKPTQMLIL